MKKLIRKGKVKEVYELDKEKLQFLFTDNISVFDQIVPNDIPRKGETLCKTSSYWFRKADEELGMRTHFVDMPEDNKMTVKKVDVISDYEGIDEDTSNYLIPLEFICRYFVAGSLHDRLKNGQIDPGDVGFDKIPEYGKRLPDPLFEVTTKLEDFDKKLDKEEALKISGLTEEEYEEIEQAILDIDKLVEENVEKNGLIHADGKKEFAMDEDRNIMLVDTFGTADEDRFWNLEEYEKGNFVHNSKEFVRQYYRESGYHAELMEARNKGEEEPSIPPLPEEKVKKTSRLYINTMHRLTDGVFKK